MRPDKLVNIHTHLHAGMDVPARVREWESHGCVKSVVLADSRYWQPPRSTYLGNEGVLKWMREFPDRIVGMGNVELGEEILPAAGAAFDGVRDGYRRGLFRNTDVLEAQRTLVELRLREIDAVRAYHVARAALERLTAGARVQP